MERVHVKVGDEVQEGDVLPHEVIAEKGDFAEYEPGKPYKPVEEPVVTTIN